MKYLLIILSAVSLIWSQTTTWIEPNPIQAHYTWMDSLNTFQDRLMPIPVAALAVVGGPFEDVNGDGLNNEIRGLVALSNLPDRVWSRIPGQDWPIWQPLKAPVRRRGATGVWTTPGGKIFLTWRWSHNISEAHVDQGELIEDTIWGTPGRADGQLGEPIGIAVTTAGEYYILERLNNRISVFDKDHNFQRASYPSRKYPMHDPVAFTLHDGNQEWTNLRESYLIVIDDNGHRMVKLDLNGTIRAVMDKDFPFEDYDFKNVTTDYYGCVYVTDSLNNQIHKFDPQLKYQVSIGAQSGDHFLKQPAGITFDNRYGQVWVSDTNGVHYYWVGTDTLNWRAGYSSLKNAVMGRFQLTEPAYVTVQIKDSSGTLLETIIDHQKNLFDPIQYSWHIPWGFKQGVINVEVQLTPTYASRKYFTKVVSQPISLLSRWRD